MRNLCTYTFTGRADHTSPINTHIYNFTMVYSTDQKIREIYNHARINIETNNLMINKNKNS